MLAIARALLLKPRFLLVDELTLGLSERVAVRLLEALVEIAQLHTMGVLLVEQDYQLALSWSAYAYILVDGRVQFAGPAGDAALRTDLFRPVFMPID